jgi:hypothetical protein
LNSAQPSQAGDYDVLVFNAAGSAVSSNAILAGLSANHRDPAAKRARAHPARSQAAPTTNAAFSVTAYSSSPMRFQWRFNGIDIPGATNVVLIITNVQVANGGEYSVVVSDDIGTGFSAPATLYPLVSPQIVLPPLNQTVAVGGTVTMGVAASGSPLPFSFEWRRGSIVVASNVVNSYANFYSYIAPNSPTQQAYRVIVRNLANQGINANWPVTNYTVADIDGDGIPDSYEAAHGTGGQLDPGADPDGDTMSNYAEYLAGTDPTDRLSYLKVELLLAGQGAVLQFNAATNTSYTVQYTDTLGSGSWQRLRDVVAQPATRVEMITDPGGSSSRVYRLVTPSWP